MHKITLEPMIKRPASPGAFGTILITLVLLAALGAALTVAGHRMIEYSEYLYAENV